MHRTEQETHERHFVEEVGLVLDEMGAPRMMGRIVGFLLICEPEHQSSQQIAAYLDASRGSVSTVTRMLVASGMIERVPIQNARSTFFRITEGAWTKMMRQRAARLQIMRDVAKQGLELLSDAPPERRRRLKQFHDFYTYLERESHTLIDRWDAEHPEEDT